MNLKTNNIKTMKNIYKVLMVSIAFFALMVPTDAMAGNKDRSGQAGAQHLLVDPWARTNGWSNAGIAEIRGIEALYSNVAGMAFIKKTEIGFTRTQYLSGSGANVGINAFGIAQGLSKVNAEGRRIDLGTLGVSLFNMGFGNIPVTTVEQPEGTSAMFAPKLNWIGIHYAKSFNKYIHAGISFKIINESITDIRANGFAFDAGVQYVTGAYENLKIGVALKNIGLPMSYKGDGLTLRAIPTIDDHELTMEQRSALYELPASLSIGLSYDFLFFPEPYKSMDREDRKEEGLTRADADHRLTLALAFTANAYSRDEISFGVEYGFSRFLMIRAGYLLEMRPIGPENSTSFYTGPSAGATVAIPLSKENKRQQLLFDYAYRFTKQWQGNHYIGVRVAL